MQRRAIPADLRRRILVEAGHRCAIHTCRSPEVEIHHIEPWADTQDHRYEDLIALCANCHARADRGQIDRKSLRLYKARLVAAFRFEEPQVYPGERDDEAARFSWIDSLGRWDTEALQESDPSVSYEAQLEYPVFRGQPDLSLACRQIVCEELLVFRDGAVYSADARSHPSSLGYQLSSSYSVALMTRALASVRFTVQHDAGGPHPNHHTRVLNATLDPFASFRISELFSDSREGLRVLSEYCIGKLLSPEHNGRERSPESVKHGAAPESRNFERFNITSEALVVTFDTYTIGSYVEGWAEVAVPIDTVWDLLQEGFRKRLSIEATRA